jgi:chromosome segregation ATPase
MQVSTAARQLLDLTFSLAKSKETCKSLATDIDQLKSAKQNLLDRVEAHNKRAQCRNFYELDQSIRHLKDERKALQRRQEEQKTDLDLLTKKIETLKIGKNQTAEKMTELQVIVNVIHLSFTIYSKSTS